MNILSRDKKSIRLFDAFEVDYELPKWKKRLEEGSRFMMYNNITRTRDGRLNVNSGIFLDVMSIRDSIVGAGPEKKPNFFERIFSKKKTIAEKEAEFYDNQRSNVVIQEIPAEDPKPEMSVEEFFNSMKNSVEELVLVKSKLDGYEAALEKLAKLGQVSLYESMKFDVEMYRAEAQMYATGMTKYISEDNAVKFVLKSHKALHLDWIKNFVRIIPDDVAEKKIKADELHIFDNYVILHYDPEGKASDLTLEEKAAKADPILFGVVIGSRKLYYIGDWIDEYCDLTLDGIIEHMGENSIGTITENA